MVFVETEKIERIRLHLTGASSPRLTPVDFPLRFSFRVLLFNEAVRGIVGAEVSMRDPDIFVEPVIN